MRIRGPGVDLQACSPLVKLSPAKALAAKVLYYSCRCNISDWQNMGKSKPTKFIRSMLGYPGWRFRSDIGIWSRADRAWIDVNSLDDGR